MCFSAISPQNANQLNHFPYFPVSVIVCPAPSAPSQGSMTEAGPAPDRRYLLGDFVQFQCASGHLLKGAAVSSCQADGTWSAQTPLCEYFRFGA